MKIILAPDSYKGSATAVQVVASMKRAIEDISDTDIIVEKPMADGGEGTVDALLTSVGGEKVQISCIGPLGKKVETYYAITEDNTAVIEVANIAGLVQVPLSLRNINHTTTYGVGEVLLNAIDKGCNRIIIGLGGSATNDGGLGMLQALGLRAWDEKGNSLSIYGEALLSIAKVDESGLDKRLKDIDIIIASDVENPLCGREGASYIYGSQKGATKEEIISYDSALATFIEMLNCSNELSQKKGAGAAGGLGFALLYLGGKMESGAKLVGEITSLEEAIRDADFIITGEGQSDEQTLYGKAPGYVANLGAKYEVPTILISGSIGNADTLRSVFLGCFSITNRPLTLKECIEDVEELIMQQTKNIYHLVKGLQ